MKVYIKESKAYLLKESKDEVTFFRFFTEVKKYIRDLLVNPTNAEPSNFFDENGISKNKLTQMLIDNDVVARKERIDEPYDDDKGKIVSKYYVSYKVPKKGFKDKLRNMYNNTFKSK